MDLKYIICGKPVGKEEMCTGIIKNMKVTVCKEHHDAFKNCEKRICEHA